MSLIRRWSSLFNRAEKRNLSDPWHWLARIVSSGSSAGINVTVDTAMKAAAVYACNKVLSETIASLPLFVYHRLPAGGKEPVQDHPLSDILHYAPNDFQTSYEWREGYVSHLNFRGNSYQQKIMKAGRIRQLIPLNPANMQVVIENGKIIYRYKYEDGVEKSFNFDEIWHLKNLSISTTYSGGMPEGIIGLSPISVARETIGTALAADEYAGRYFSNNASIGLQLTHPGKLNDNAKEFLKSSLAEYGKLENKFKSLILEEGMEAKVLGISNEDSQFLESRNFQVEDIARIFRVPSVLIGHPDTTMTYASAEQLFLSFVTHTIRPYCVRLEQSMNRWLLTEKERKEFFIEHVLAGLLRGDIKSRYEAYAIGRNWGFINVDEIRSLENMNPLPEEKGQVYLQPLNMTEAGVTPAPASAPIPARTITQPITVYAGKEKPEPKKRKVKFSRDLKGKIINAEIEEEIEDGDNTGTL